MNDEQIKKDNAAGSLLEPVVMWEVWMEGYLCTGMEGRPAKASYHGQWPGKTFKDACQSWCDADKSRKQYFNPDRLTYWGCRLYDHEIAISNRSGKAMRPQQEES